MVLTSIGADGLGGEALRARLLQVGDGLVLDLTIGLAGHFLKDLHVVRQTPELPELGAGDRGLAPVVRLVVDEQLRPVGMGFRFVLVLNHVFHHLLKLMSFIRGI